MVVVARLADTAAEVAGVDVVGVGGMGADNVQVHPLLDCSLAVEEGSADDGESSGAGKQAEL